LASKNSRAVLESGLTERTRFVMTLMSTEGYKACCGATPPSSQRGRTQLNHLDMDAADRSDTVDATVANSVRIRF